MKNCDIFTFLLTVLNILSECSKSFKYVFFHGFFVIEIKGPKNLYILIFRIYKELSKHNKKITKPIKI